MLLEINMADPNTLQYDEGMMGLANPAE